LFIVEGDVHDEQPKGDADGKDLEDAGEGEPEGGRGERLHHSNFTARDTTLVLADGARDCTKGFTSIPRSLGGWEGLEPDFPSQCALKILQVAPKVVRIYT
jgi:hypothetical protein